MGWDEDDDEEEDEEEKEEGPGVGGGRAGPGGGRPLLYSLSSIPSSDEARSPRPLPRPLPPPPPPISPRSPPPPPRHLPATSPPHTPSLVELGARGQEGGADEEAERVAAALAARGAAGRPAAFLPAAEFAGARQGYAYKVGPLGVGYYVDGEEEEEEEEAAGGAAAAAAAAGARRRAAGGGGRGEGCEVRLLDRQFERLMCDYSDDEIGELEQDDPTVQGARSRPEIGARSARDRLRDCVAP